MASLRNVQGRSLVADPTASLNLLLKTFGTKQSRDKEKEAKAKEAEIRKQIEIILGGGSDQGNLDKGREIAQETRDMGPLMTIKKLLGL